MFYSYKEIQATVGEQRFPSGMYVALRNVVASPGASAKGGECYEFLTPDDLALTERGFGLPNVTILETRFLWFRNVRIRDSKGRVYKPTMIGTYEKIIDAWEKLSDAERNYMESLSPEEMKKQRERLEDMWLASQIEFMKRAAEKEQD